MSSYWREKARPIVARVLAETAGADEATVRRALREAYPFGPRRMWPERAWLDEVKAQRAGITTGAREESARERREALEAVGQQRLWDEG